MMKRPRKKKRGLAWSSLIDSIQIENFYDFIKYIYRLLLYSNDYIH